MAQESLMDGKKILLVDDEPDVLDTLEDLLSMCEVVKCTNFKAAKDYMESRHFDMAVLDIMGVEGYALLDIAVGRKITAVMLTAHALSPENVVRSYKEGAAAYLPKEEMINIVSFLEDIIKAKEQGKNPWTNWYGRMASFFEKKFGPNWQKNDKEFWEKFPFY
jgi:DNA-binding NtrC family response regulator